MPEVLKRGCKDVKYVNCEYCGSRLRFYHHEVKTEISCGSKDGKEFRTLVGKISCPACHTIIRVCKDEIWNENVSTHIDEIAIS